jgi:hypothetical protein
VPCSLGSPVSGVVGHCRENRFSGRVTLLGFILDCSAPMDWRWYAAHTLLGGRSESENLRLKYSQGTPISLSSLAWHEVSSPAVAAVATAATRNSQQLQQRLRAFRGADCPAGAQPGLSELSKTAVVWQGNSRIMLHRPWSRRLTLVLTWSGHVSSGSATPTSTKHK